ncbi:MAG TPA: helix-turn-helix transcriptional regulator [Ktedonosporobacter sp.]|nr:helix-turn-helix transcriptional regulator [Ktedonosporobacter sp.]
METDHLSRNNDLSFSLEGAAGPEIDAPSRFARALKYARFRKGWTQAKLAAQLAITKRAIVSWETAARIPSIGMVLALLDALSGDGLSLQNALLYSYILDDLERQLRRKDPESGQENTLSHRLRAVISQVEQIASGEAQQLPQPVMQGAETQAPYSVDEAEKPRPDSSSEPSLEPLFALLTQLHRHPDLIPVAYDFVRELRPGE